MKEYPSREGATHCSDVLLGHSVSFTHSTSMIIAIVTPPGFPNIPKSKRIFCSSSSSLLFLMRSVYLFVMRIAIAEQEYQTITGV
jgi:hypothetical protein